MKWQIYCRSNPPVEPSTGQEMVISHFYLLEIILADEVADLPPPQYCHLVVKNGNFTFLLLEFILADEVADLLADLPPGSAI